MAGTLLLCIHLGTLHGSPLVGGDDIEGRSVLLDDAAVDPDHSFAQSPDLTHLVTYEHNGATALGDLAHFPKTFFLKLKIAHRQHLVHQQNFGLELSSHGEGQTHLHAGAEMLERRINEFIHLGERHNLIKFALDLTLAHAKNGPAQENVLATRELGMETCSDLKQAAHSPVNLGKTGCRACDPREDLEQRGLASSIATYQANDLTFLNVEGNVAERPELLAAAMLAASTVPSKKPAPARRNERSRIGDGGGKHPKLDDEGDDVADVAIKSVERREP